MARDSAMLNTAFMSTSIERARAIAKAKGWKQAELARRIGVGPQRLQNWIKRGGIPRDMLARTAKVLGVSVDWLLNGDAASGEDLEATAANLSTESQLAQIRELLQGLFALVQEMHQAMRDGGALPPTSGSTQELTPDAGGIYREHPRAPASPSTKERGTR